MVDSESPTEDPKNKIQKGKTRDIIAEKIKVSPHTVDTINKAIQLEDDYPEIKKLFS